MDGAIKSDLLSDLIAIPIDSGAVGEMMGIARPISRKREIA
jgi:hypothetical protein